MSKLLMIDNYDSFTYNLVHLLEKIHEGEISVVRNDEIDIDAAENYEIIVLSPGPKLPKDTPNMREIIHTYHAKKSIIGICLGMQGIAEYFGCTLENLSVPEHGQSKKMKVIKRDEVFKDCPSEFFVGRYHSWGVKSDKLKDCLIPLSIDENNWVMSFKHKKYKIYGLQYHPESILTEYGEVVMQNIINAIKIGKNNMISTL